MQPSACRGGGLRDSTGCKSTAYSLGATTVCRQRGRDRACEDCSPPRRVAADCAALRAAEARPIWFRTFVQFCRVRAAASGPGIEDAPPQARRLCEPQKLSQQLGPVRRENRNRFSRLKNRYSPKLDPVLRPVSVSLRFRYRSATFCRRPLGFHLIFANAKRAKSLFKRAGDGVFARYFFARLGKSCQNTQASFDDFPLKAWRAAVRQEGTALGPRGPHVPWTGNARAFPLAASTRFSVRAPARFIYIRLTPK